MNLENKNMNETIDQKLNLIAGLLLRLLPKDGISLKDQVRLLNELGVRPIDIAKITGRSQGHVGKELVAIRKNK